MATKYRVILQRKNMMEALFSGRGYRDWYVAQVKRLIGWKTIAIYPTAEEAERACTDHAGGTLLPDGAKIVAEFIRPD